MAATRQELITEITLGLGGGMIDVELDPEHYNLSIDKALRKYRQRAENSVEESFLILQLQTDQNEYTLPNTITEVRDIYTRTSSVTGMAGNEIEPFEAAYLNLYFLHTSRSGGMANFDMLAQSRETLGKLFGSEIQFTFNTVSKKLTLHRRIKSQSDVILHIYNLRTEVELFTDPYSGSWIKEWSLAEAKMMLGEARSKFATIASPQGGTQLNGDTLKQDAMASKEKLEQELTLYVDGSAAYGFVIG